MLLRVGSKINDSMPFSDSIRLLFLHQRDRKIRSMQIVGVAVALVLVTAFSGFHIMYNSSDVLAFEDSALLVQGAPLYAAVYNSKNASCSVEGIHLAQRSDMDEQGYVSMTVSFFLPYRPCLGARPIVSYGRAGKKSNHKTAHVPDALHLNYASRMTENKTFLSDWVYHVEIPKLKAGLQEYWYRIDLIEAETSNDVEELTNTSSIRVNNDSKPNLVPGKVHHFSTPPRLGSPTSIAIVADVGDTRVSHRTIQGMKEASASDNEYPASLAIIAGDIAYADGEPYLWSKWFGNTEYLFQNLPLSVSVGNHEVEVSTSWLVHFV